ncbi:MAG: hypothetical protein U0Y82_09090 [Thermoleophilia bacterium]
MVLAQNRPSTDLVAFRASCRDIRMATSGTRVLKPGAHHRRRKLENTCGA